MADRRRSRGTVNAAKPFHSASLAPFDLATLERDAATICALDHELRVTYVNPAWCAFSRANGGTWGDGRWAIGVALLDSVPTQLRSFYERLFERARTSAAPVEHSYECSSPATLRRSRMRIFRCHDGALLVTHSLSQPVSDRWVASQAVERTYRNEEGIIVQCSHCRRVRRIGTSAARWDWVPDYLTGREANISHGVCTLCVEYHYTPRERDDSPESAETARGSASILVAGEDAPVRSLVARVLRRAGHAVTEARDRAEALRALERDPFDVVLLDESVPGMETDTDAIRVLQPSTRIVGLGTPTDPRRARVLSRIQKPFTPQALLDGVRAALGRLT